MSNKTLFQKIIAGDLPGNIPYQDEKAAVIIALEGHPLVVPKEHYTDIFDLPDDVAAAIMQTTVKVAKALKLVTNCDGINLVQSNGASAGQEVFHFHMHVKPRFVGDDTSLNWNTETTSEKSRGELADKIKSVII